MAQPAQPDEATPEPAQPQPTVVEQQIADLEAKISAELAVDPTSPRLRTWNNAVAELQKIRKRVEAANQAAISRDAPKRAAKAYHDLTGFDLGDFPRNDNENKDLLAKRAEEKIRYLSGKGYQVFNGQRFVPDANDNSLTGQVVSQHNHDLVKAAEAAGDKFLVKRALDFGEGTALNAALTWLKRAPGVHAQSDDFDHDPMLLNVQNGTIDLATGTLREHRPKDLISQISPITWDPDAKCPNWRTFIQKISAPAFRIVGTAPPGEKGESLESFLSRVNVAPREDLADFLQIIAGYCLTSHVREEVFFLFNGEGANGKTTFVNIMKRLMGDYFLSMNSVTFSAKFTDQHPTGIADLAGRRLAFVDEGPKTLNLTMVKWLTGESQIAARKMRQDFFRFDPRFKLIFNTNGLPSVGGDNQPATWRRIIPVPFDLTIPTPHIRQTIETELARELPGILNWAIEGCLRWQSLGMGLHPASERVDCIQAMRAAYRDEENPIDEFVTECFTIFSAPDCGHPNGGCAHPSRTPTGAVQVAYKGWCDLHGYKDRLAPGHLGRELKLLGKTRGFHPEKIGDKRWWVGLVQKGAPSEIPADDAADGGAE